VTREEYVERLAGHEGRDDRFLQAVAEADPGIETSYWEQVLEVD
jgi:hypothetical protein